MDIRTLVCKILIDLNTGEKEPKKEDYGVGMAEFWQAAEIIKEQKYAEGVFIAGRTKNINTIAVAFDGALKRVTQNGLNYIDKYKGKI